MLPNMFQVRRFVWVLQNEPDHRQNAYDRSMAKPGTLGIPDQLRNAAHQFPKLFQSIGFISILVMGLLNTAWMDFPRMIAEMDRIL